MKIQAPPGMRDFYPEEMRIQNWLFDAWRRVSQAFGFVEYEGPIFEFLDLYTLKSGDEIVKQLFTVRRGESEGTDAEARFAIRPEMTPTLARMVAARANALPRPIKWFSLPRMCRGERPQRGRLREFFQWNADILGSDDVIADAEIVALLAQFVREIGLTRDDVVVRYSSRRLVTAQLAALGISPEQQGDALALIDRLEKLPREEFDRQWSAAYASVPVDGLHALLASPPTAEALATARLDEFAARLADFGVAEFCEFDFRIVRGLAYYTGIVFELHARQTALRALAGGGRYDNLTALLDGPAVTGVGFGMGDAPILELLRELNKLPTPGEGLTAFVIDAEEGLFPKALEIVGKLRAGGVACDFSYKRQAIGKQFKQASSRNAAYAIVVGRELAERGELTVKNLQTGEQKGVAAAELMGRPQAILVCDAAM